MTNKELKILIKNAWMNGYAVGSDRGFDYAYMEEHFNRWYRSFVNDMKQHRGVDVSTPDREHLLTP